MVYIDHMTEQGIQLMLEMSKAHWTSTYLLSVHLQHHFLSEPILLTQLTDSSRIVNGLT